MTSTSGRSARTSTYCAVAIISGSVRSIGITTPPSAAASSSSAPFQRPIAPATAFFVSGTPSRSWARCRSPGYMFCGITQRPSAQRKNENDMALPVSTLEVTG